MREFRFGAMLGRAESRADWLDQVLRAEELGYSTAFISDHFTDKLAPLPALAMVAEHTSMRVGTLVLANDFRHPAVLAKEAATVDLLSDGRLELGIGTGWAEGDYAASGIHKAPAATQVDRLEESVRVLRGLWGPGSLEFAGDHYRIDLDGLPKPGLGRPRLLIGGGARRILGLAGRMADIVGISAGGIVTRADLGEQITSAGEKLDDKIEWVRDGAGDRFDDLEFNILLFGVEVGDRGGGASRLAEAWETSPASILASPHFLAGGPDEIAADLEERRRRWHISYPVIPANRLEAMAPVVQQLTGT